MSFIKWCNDNNGFLTALLSIVGLTVSIIAIIVSIRTARLPYKKKILLGSSFLLEASVIPNVSVKTSFRGISSAATNIGNRKINLIYLGYAIKKEGKYNKLYPTYRKFNSKATLEPSEMFEVEFMTDEILKAFSMENPNKKIYICI